MHVLRCCHLHTHTYTYSILECLQSIKYLNYATCAHKLIRKYDLTVNRWLLYNIAAYKDSDIML